MPRTSVALWPARRIAIALLALASVSGLAARGEGHPGCERACRPICCVAANRGPLVRNASSRLLASGPTCSFSLPKHFRHGLLALGGPATAPRAPQLAHTLTPAERNAESLLVVHYRRPDGAYEGWNLWCWPEGGEGTAYPFDGTDLQGRYAIVPFATTPDRAGIVVRRGNWEAKDIDQDRFVPLARGGVTEVWLAAGDETVRTAPAADDPPLRAVGAFLDGPKRITLATTAPLSDAQRAAIDVLYADGGKPQRRVRRVTEAEPSGGRRIYEIELAQPVAAEDVGALAIRFPSPHFEALADQPIFARDVLDGDAFAALDVPFGAQCTPTSTRFATWSPVSSKVELLLHENADSYEPTRIIALEATGNGVWQREVEGDLHGVPYRYRFTNYGERRTVPDMHCHAATADSSRSVVVDLDRLRPERWNEARSPKLADPTDEVIYEVHVRDFSVRDESCPPDARGTYLGLASEAGARHLAELGVTAVHLLPVHDFTARRDEYNWGYWTTLFNAPESNYATDPDDPTSAIRDLRAAIVALHERGIRVLLDVVYNHTSDADLDSPFGAAVPHYFFRTTRDGRLVNDTGVGNTIADERPMMRKYIVDSLVHWLHEYRVDGFRFDLVGCFEPETVRAICERLNSARSDLTLYGEPWTGGGRVRFGKGSQRGMGFAVFNDHLRNAIRGDLDGTAVGFATGEGGDVAAIRRGVMGAIDDFAQEPGESVSYVSAHDNLTLWDKIVKTQPGASDAERRSMQKLALGIVLTSQGIAFLHGGSEFCRTKGGHHNSYDAGDDVNHFDWRRRQEYDDVVDYVAGLVALRRAHPAFTMSDDAEVRSALAFLDAEDASGGVTRPIAFTLDGTVAKDTWTRILVAYNDEPTAATLRLPEGEWTVVVDASRSGVEALRVATGSIELPPYSMVVAHRGE